MPSVKTELCVAKSHCPQSSVEFRPFHLPFCWFCHEAAHLYFVQITFTFVGKGQKGHEMFHSFRVGPSGSIVVTLFFFFFFFFFQEI